MLLSFGPWIVFMIAMLIRLLHNFSNGSLTLFACDGYEYATVAKSLYTFIANSFNANGNGNLSLLQGLHDAGPVFPLFIALSCAIFGQIPSAAQVLPLLITQSLISSLTCVLIVFIGNICWDRRVGLIGGLMAAIYPAFIVNSGRLYAETLAAFLLAALLLLTCHLVADNRQRLSMVLTVGAIAALLQLTRPAMFGLTFLVPIFILIGSWINNQRSAASSIKLLAAYLIGFALLMLPWMGFSKLAFGNASVLVDRHSHYNLYIGNNIDSLGWLSLPNPPLVGIERASFPQILRCDIGKNFGRWCALLQDKVLRLFKFPCNDFRTPIGPFNFYAQALFHQILLLMAAIGIAAIFLTRPNHKQRVCQLLLFTVLCFHFIYILFIAMARYNLTAMPVVLLYAAAGCLLLFDLIRADKTRATGLRLVIASFILFAAVLISFNSIFLARANGRLYEVQKRIEKLGVAFPINGGQTLYLLIDSNGMAPLLHNIVIKVNGQQLKGPLVPELSLLGNLSSFNTQDPNYIYLESGFIFASLTGPSHISNVDLRQWFLIPLPNDLVKSAKNLAVELSTAGSPVTFYEQVCTHNHVTMPSPYKCSWEKAFFGVEDAGSFCDPRYDLELPCTTTPLVPDLLLLSSNTNSSTVPVPAQAVSTSNGLFIQSKSIPAYHKDDFWIVRLSGTASVGQLVPKVSVISQSNQQFNYNPPWLPPTVGTSFDLAFPLIPSALPGKLESIALHLNGSPAQAKSYAIEIYRLPHNPVTAPCNIQIPKIVNQG